jgi:hypothetical protein
MDNWPHGTSFNVPMLVPEFVEHKPHVFSGQRRSYDCRRASGRTIHVKPVDFVAPFKKGSR